MASKVRGDTIRALRKITGLTQREFAEKHRISDRTLKKAENGQEISEKYARKIAAALNVDLSKLYEAPALSVEGIIDDMVAHCMSNIYYLCWFVREVQIMEIILGRDIEVSDTAIRIVNFSDTLYGPFERPAHNLPLVKGGYCAEPATI